MYSIYISLRNIYIVYIVYREKRYIIDPTPITHTLSKKIRRETGAAFWGATWCDKKNYLARLTNICCGTHEMKMTSSNAEMSQVATTNRLSNVQFCCKFVCSLLLIRDIGGHQAELCACHSPCGDSVINNSSLCCRS